MDERPITLRNAREDTIDALCRQFAEDALSMGELERRLERARAAQNRGELDALLADLRAPAPAPPPARRPATRPVARSESTAARGGIPAPAGDRGERPSGSLREAGHVAVAVLGGTRRAGRWAPPSQMMAVAVMGGVELDFRDAVLKSGVTEINCFAFWGGVDITVPPDVHVETQGFALMGGFDQESELEVDPAPDAPVIRVTGFALMGGVSIKVRDRGERGSDARSRVEQRMQRRLDRIEERSERPRGRHHGRRGGW